MRPEHIADLRVPSDPNVAPSRDVAFVVTRADLDEDRYERRIWRHDGDGARPFTAGPEDTKPRWSPDGSRLAFRRKTPGEPAQLAVIASAGGEAEVLTDFPLGVEDLAWSPDGRRIAVVATTWIDEWDGLDDDERHRRPRRIERFGYRFDHEGWRHDRRSHLWIVDVDGREEPLLLTPGEFDETQPVWSPDGERLAFVSARHSTRGMDPGTQVWTVPAAGGEPDAAVEPGLWSLPSYDPAGRLHVVGLPDVDAHPGVKVVWRVETDGSLVPLTAALDRDIAPFSPPLAPGGVRWLPDGTALAHLEDRGTIGVVRIHPDGRVDRILGGERAIVGMDPHPAGDGAALVVTTPTDPGELWWWDGAEERRLTGLNDAFRETVELVAPERFTIEHEDVAIDGWVYLPPGDEPVPLLLQIHGGPASQYGYGFFDEFQVYVEAGYGVVATNPRGSSGYGLEHVRAIVGRWAEERPPDLRDLLAAPEHAAASFPRLDLERRGVMGGSYGGYATIRVLALDPGYRSAVAERGLYAWPSFTGTSDIGPWFERAYLGVEPEEGWAPLHEASPVAVAGRIVTPTLLIHSEEDWRCPIEQAEQLFARLLRHGTTTALLRFPGEGHELSRKGAPRHRVERFEAILDWHAEHLR